MIHPPARPGLTRRSLLKSGAVLAGFSAVMLPASGALAAREAADDLIVTSYKLNPPRWPAGQKLSICVIADLHAGGPNMGLDRVRQVVDAGNALQCDLIVLMGDYFATHPFVTERVPAPAWAGELARLRARRGVHDLLGTLTQVTSDDPVILLAHEPDIFPTVPERVSLTLAGHTHGGQVRLPFLTPLWAPSKYGARYVYGHVVEQGRHLIVSGGLGCSKVPLRFGVPPEIVRVDLGA